MGRVRNRGKYVEMMRWLHAHDFGLCMLVLDMKGILVTVEQDKISLRGYCNDTNVVVQKLSVKHGPRNEVRCNPPGHRPVLA